MAANVQAKPIANRELASRAQKPLSSESVYREIIRQALERYLGHPLKPEEERAFLKLLEQDMQPADVQPARLFSDEQKNEIIAKILASLESSEKENLEREKQGRRASLIVAPALGAVYAYLGRELFVRAMEAGAVGSSVLAEAGKTAGTAAKAAGGISRITLETGRQVGGGVAEAAGGVSRITFEAGRKAAAGLGSGANTAVSAAFGVTGAIASSTSRATKAAGKELGLNDVVVELRPRKEPEIDAIEKALNSGREKRILNSVRKALVKLNAMHEVEIIASPVYNYFIQLAEDGAGRIEPLVSALAQCRKEKELYDISTRVTKAIHAYGSPEARSLAWDALSPQEERSIAA